MELRHNGNTQKVALFLLGTLQACKWRSMLTTSLLITLIIHTKILNMAGPYMWFHIEINTAMFDERANLVESNLNWARSSKFQQINSCLFYSCPIHRTLLLTNRVTSKDKVAKLNTYDISPTQTVYFIFHHQCCKGRDRPSSENAQNS